MKMRYLAVLLGLTTLSALLLPLPASVLAQADDHSLEWEPVDTPGLTGNIVVSPSEVNEIAIGSGGTIYALDTSANATKSSKVYQSVNGGASWADITSYLLRAGAVLPATKIAVAPDNTGMVAVVTDSGTRVYLSTNRGSTWTNTNVPSLAGTIQAITISKKYTVSDVSVSEIAIGTAEWNNNTTTGQVWVCQVGTSSWQNQYLKVDPTDPTQIGGEVSAIAYSPNYPRDDTIIIVASTSDSDITNAYYKSQTWLCLGKRNKTAETTSWNAPVFSDYPVAISTVSEGDASGVSQITSSLALPSNYSSSDEDLRRLFVSYDRDPDANDDVYRINNDTPYVSRLNVHGGVSANISSIAYYGTTTSGKLLAGDINPVAGSLTVQVRRTVNPFSLLPTWTLATLPPSGPGHARVSWSSDGQTAYCGTGQSPGVALDESAFSASTDDGDNWQQLSLMDTTLKLSDIAVTPDSKTLFLATYSASGPEGVWRTTLTELGIGKFWSRQLNINTTSQRIILRLSPDYLSDYTIYVVEAGGNYLAVSHNRGNSWKRRLTTGTVVDAVVADRNTLYVALAGGKISWTTDGGFIWSEQVPTGIADINMLTMTSNGTILVGGRNGEVAYSTDGGASFTKIYYAVGGGDVQVVADANYQENGIIYAATNVSDSGTWRWQIGVSSRWEQIDKSITEMGTGQRIDGLVTSSEGTLYALRMEPAGGISRSLNPAAMGENEVAEFDVINQAGTTFDSSAIFFHTLPYLKFSTDTGLNELWSIDTAHEVVYRFRDTLATNSPTIISPINMFQDIVNSITGRAKDIVFSWNTPSLNVTNYETGVYADAACTMRLLLCNVASTSPTPAVAVGPYQSATSNQCIEYIPNTIYYWRVRVTQPIRSPWSETFRFTIATLPAIVTDLLSPRNGTTDISQTPAFSWTPIAGANEYQLVLAGDANFASPIVSTMVNNAGFAMTEKLDYGRTYFWKVRAVSPAGNDWSTIASFTIREAPTEPSLPVITVQATAPVTIITLTVPASTVLQLAPSLPPSSIVPVTIWAIIGIGSILVIAIIVLIVRTAR